MWCESEQFWLDTNVQTKHCWGEHCTTKLLWQMIVLVMHNWWCHLKRCIAWPNVLEKVAVFQSALSQKINKIGGVGLRAGSLAFPYLQHCPKRAMPADHRPGSQHCNRNTCECCWSAIRPEKHSVFLPNLYIASVSFSWGPTAEGQHLWNYNCKRSIPSNWHADGFSWNWYPPTNIFS